MDTYVEHYSGMKWVAASFIIGIAAFNFFPFFPVSIIALCVLTTAFLFLIPPNPPLPKGGRGDFFGKIFFIILIFVSGFLYGFIRHDTVSEIRLPDWKVFVKGTVINVPEVSGERGWFTIDEVSVGGERVNGRIRLSVLPEIFGRDKVPGHLLPAYGDRVGAVAKLKEPRTFRNPGVYSYDFKKRGIVAIGYIKQVQVIGKESGFLSWIYGKRWKLGEIINNSLSGENASLHRAIIPGLKKGISQDMRDAFSSTGLAHLLSISGTHFGLLAFIIFKFIKTVIKSLPMRFLTRMTLYITPAQAAVILTLPVLALYALISGTSTPTIRSFIMVFIFMLALFLGRKGQWLNSLSIAAIIILLWRPDALFELSFILSFTAVLSIGYVLEKKTELENRNKELESEYITKTAEPSGAGYKLICRNFMQKSFNSVKTGLMITIAAVFGTAPVVAVYFKQFPLISPLTNLIVTPLVCFIILPLGFFTGFSALLFNMPSMPLSGVTDAITRSVLTLVKAFSAVPYSDIHVHNPSFAIIVLYFFSLMFMIKSRIKWRFLPFVFTICLYIVSPYLFSVNSVKVAFLDVGQGEASVVELPDKRVMLIDGGTYDPDTGRRVVAPYLWSKGIRKIDFMVLSHPHPDHYGGLIYIMDNFTVGEVWFNGRMRPGAEFLKRIQENKIPGRVLRRGDVLEAEKYRIYVLHPYDEFYADSARGEFSDENSNSLVLKIETGSSSILFTGDIETEAEENLIYLGRWLRSDIIKVPHHGGRTSSSMEFLEVVSPETAVVSAGRDNPFNHPHRETLERYNDAGIKLLRTDVDGAVTVTSTGSSYDIKTYWDSRFKKVNGLKDEIRNLRLLLRII